MQEPSEALAEMLDAELSSSKVLPLSPGQRALLVRLQSSFADARTRFLARAARQLEVIRLEKILHGQGGMPTELEKRVEEVIHDALFGPRRSIVLVRRDVHEEASLVSLSLEEAEDLIGKGMGRLIAEIGNSLDRDEVLPKVQGLYSPQGDNIQGRQEESAQGRREEACQKAQGLWWI